MRRARLGGLFAAALALALVLVAGVQASPDPARVFADAPTAVLARAIAAGDAAGVRQLVQAGAKLSARGQDDVTLLQWAMLREQPRMLALLLDLGADPAQQGYAQQTAMHTAAMAKKRPYLQILLDHGASPDLTDGRTQASVLSEALMNRNDDAVRLLLARHANPNLADRQGDTPLHVAAQINDYAAMLALLKAGADPLLRNRSGQTFEPYFAIHPKESQMSWQALAARQAVQDWLTAHGGPPPPQAARMQPQRREQNTLCRGLHGDDPRTQPACDERQRLGRALYRQGWCYGEKGQTSDRMQWHRCHAGSTPHE